MANTYTSIYLHIIFAVKNRAASLLPTSVPRVHQYISGIIKQHGHHPIRVGGTENHVHIFIGYNVNHKVSDLVKEIKTSTNAFVNQQKLSIGHFSWQTGYACFSYSKSQVESVINYIANQYQHHKNHTMEEEIRHFLDLFGIPYDSRYVLKEPE